MKLDLTKTILGLDGKVINSTKEAFVLQRDETGKDTFLKSSTGEDLIVIKEMPEEALTIKMCLIKSLLSETKDQSVADKAKKFALFFRIENATDNTVNLTSEEVSLCKKELCATQSILIAGRCCMILELE